MSFCSFISLLTAFFFFFFKLFLSLYQPFFQSLSHPPLLSSPLFSSFFSAVLSPSFSFRFFSFIRLFFTNLFSILSPLHTPSHPTLADPFPSITVLNTVSLPIYYLPPFLPFCWFPSSAPPLKKRKHKKWKHIITLNNEGLQVWNLRKENMLKPARLLFILLHWLLWVCPPSFRHTHTQSDTNTNLWTNQLCK